MNPHPNIHPGEILREEFLKPYRVSAKELARDTKIPCEMVEAIVAERRSVSIDTALRLSRYFGTSDRFWLEMQMTYDLQRAQRSAANIESEVMPLGTAA